MPMLEVRESGCAVWFSPLVVLRVWEREMVEQMGDEQSLLVTAAVVKEEGG